VYDFAAHVTTIQEADSMRNIRHLGGKVAAPTVSVGARLGFPKTRFQGSKLRFLPFLRGALEPLAFESAVDVFGGTGAVSYLLKRLGRQVHYNDALLSNHASGLALIENGSRTLGSARARDLFARMPGAAYESVIENTFKDIFYLDEENASLDVAAQNIARMQNSVDQALARHALFQACLMKRPFNLFHRRNLALRTADVARSFGNKATWERPFPELVIEAATAVDAAVFDNGKQNRATALDAARCPLDAELVYLDPPYVRADKASFRYLDGYHFLEGICRYAEWTSLIDPSKRHLPLDLPPSPFEDPRSNAAALESLFVRAKSARHIALSYRDDGQPTIEELVRLFEKLGRRVQRFTQENTYALARKRSSEVLLIATRKHG
jgi:adenine-specific DNA-methyltransferase